MDFFNIPSPPPLHQMLTLVIAGLLLVSGLTLLMFGRVIWRAVSALLLSSAGAYVGLALGPSIGFRQPWSVLVAALIFAGLGILLARLVWATLLAAILAAAALFALMFLLPIDSETAPAGFELAELPWHEWAVQAAFTLKDWAFYLFREHAVSTPVAGIAALAGLALGLFQPLFTRITLSAAAGAIMAVMAVALALSSAKDDFSLTEGNRPFILLGILTLLWLIGLTFQYRSHHRRQPAENTDKAEPPPPPKPAAKARKQG